MATKQVGSGPDTITVPEAARRLGIGRNQGYEAARTGQLPTIRFGKRLLVPLAAFERLLRCEAQPSGAGIKIP